jgi:hypothetical protein
MTWLHSGGRRRRAGLLRCCAPSGEVGASGTSLRCSFHADPSLRCLSRLRAVPASPAAMSASLAPEARPPLPAPARTPVLLAWLHALELQAALLGTAVSLLRRRAERRVSGCALRAWAAIAEHERLRRQHWPLLCRWASADAGAQALCAGSFKCRALGVPPRGCGFVSHYLSCFTLTSVVHAQLPGHSEPALPWP